MATYKTLQFEGFSLDLDRLCLKGLSGRVNLRRKSFEVLRYLVEHAGRVVTKEEMMNAVWPEVTVSDESLTQCISEVRHALDDTSQRIIRTVPRRGYMVDVPVSGEELPAVEPRQAARAGAEVESAPCPALPDRPSIAILPFNNLSGDPEQEYFADGLAEDLITGLSRVSWLFVIARNSSFAFRGEKLDVRSIGERLGVRYIVEGSVRRAGQRLRLTVQLIEAATGNHLWADRYDGSLEDVFDFQDRIVASLVGAIEPKLRTTEIARARRKRPDSLDAFDLLLQALPKATAKSAQSVAEAIELLDRAISLSPGYAQALAYAALCRALRPILAYSPDADSDFREAAELSRRALDSDPTDPIALGAVALIAALLHRDYQAGWDLIDRSLAINPNDARAWNIRGWISNWAGETETAIAEFEKAMRLSPLDPHWGADFKHGMTFALFFSGRFEEALRWARRALQERRDWSAGHRALIAVLWLSGRHTEAREAARRYIEMFPGFSVRRAQEITPIRGTSEQELYFGAMREAGLPE